MPTGTVEGIVYGLNPETGAWKRLSGARIYVNDQLVATSRSDPTGICPEIVGYYKFPKPGNFQVNRMYCTKTNWIRWDYPYVPYLIPPLQIVRIDIYMRHI